MAFDDLFEPVIGLEVHAQLKTRSKIFCGCRVAYGEPPNSLTCPVCQGLPGALPVLNRAAVEAALRAILAVRGRVSERSVFARKNYFYPDLPKGYQISQYDQPIGSGGEVSYPTADGESKTCGLIRIHLEEDAGKLIHDESGKRETRVDLNRCGTPLIEIVSAPELHSAEDAHAYLLKLKQILHYLDVCDGDMEKGQLRCDANVSVRRQGETDLATRTELKNMNSFKGVERALRFEIDRQIALLERGEPVDQATLMWNDHNRAAEPMRTKEESHDYRYFPEPDLLDLTIDKDWVAEVRDSLPELPDAKASRLVSEYDLREYDARVLTAEKPLADYFETAAQTAKEPRLVSNWIQTELLGRLKVSGQSIDECKVVPKLLADLVNAVGGGKLSGKMAKAVLDEMIKTGFEPAKIISAHGLSLISDPEELRPVIDRVLASHPEQVRRYRHGKSKLLGYFVGQVMKETQGQADPATVNRLLKDSLEA